MCVVSMVGDFYGKKWEPYINPDPNNLGNFIFQPPVTRLEFEQLKKEVHDMVELLKRAKIYDEVNKQKDCEMEEKMAKLKVIAKEMGIDLDELLKPKQ